MANSQQFSYYCAALIKDGKWYAYLPDFNVVFEVGDAYDDVYNIAYDYIRSMLDKHYHPEKYDPSEYVVKLPDRMCMYDIIHATKMYLLHREWTLNNYVENQEIIVNYDCPN